MLVLTVKNGGLVTIDNPDGTQTTLKIRVQSSESIKLGITAPKDYQVKREKAKAGK